MLLRFTYPDHEQDRQLLAKTSALTKGFLREMEEDAAIFAIRQLTLFIICLQALICFTDVARAPPSTAPMTECLVTAVGRCACVRGDNGPEFEASRRCSPDKSRTSRGIYSRNIICQYGSKQLDPFSSNFFNCSSFRSYIKHVIIKCLTFLRGKNKKN